MMMIIVVVPFCQVLIATFHLQIICIPTWYLETNVFPRTMKIPFLDFLFYFFYEIFLL